MPSIPTLAVPVICLQLRVPIGVYGSLSQVRYWLSTWHSHTREATGCSSCVCAKRPVRFTYKTAALSALAARGVQQGAFSLPYLPHSPRLIMNGVVKHYPSNGNCPPLLIIASQRTCIGPISGRVWGPV